MKLLACALEASANLHLASILQANTQLFGIFDTAKFSAHKERAYCDYHEFNAMGFIEVLPLIFKAKKAIKELTKIALEQQIDAVLAIDSPAFNIPFIKALRKGGFKGRIIYFILPQVWAWKRSRAAKLAPLCDELIGILPFEREFWGSKFSYFGNPITASVAPYLRTQAARDFKNPADLKDAFINPANLKDAYLNSSEQIAESKANPANLKDAFKQQNPANLKDAFNQQNPAVLKDASSNKAPVIAFLPGSRRREISSLMPTFRQLAELIAAKYPDAKLLLSCANASATYGNTEQFICTKDALAALASADFAYVCSGTASLQAALIGTPFALVYKARALDFFIAKHIVKINHIGLANIIATRAKQAPLHAEYVQNFTPNELFSEFENSKASEFFKGTLSLRKLLGELKLEQISQLIYKEKLCK